eukprot:scaffold584088_cov15-Prasinocladus_malaysianus.AAC.1
MARSLISKSWRMNEFPQGNGMAHNNCTYRMLNSVCRYSAQQISRFVLVFAFLGESSQLQTTSRQQCKMSSVLAFVGTCSAAIRRLRRLMLVAVSRS